MAPRYCSHRVDIYVMDLIKLVNIVLRKSWMKLFCGVSVFIPITGLRSTSWVDGCFSEVLSSDLFVLSTSLEVFFCLLMNYVASECFLIIHKSQSVGALPEIRAEEGRIACRKCHCWVFSVLNVCEWKEVLLCTTLWRHIGFRRPAEVHDTKGVFFSLNLFLFLLPFQKNEIVWKTRLGSKRANWKF